MSFKIIPEPCKPPVESSPRMQGALPSTENHSKHYRIIPANAGSTIPTPIHDLVCQDHPRGCGEHFFQGCFTALCWGSSPRMRGALYTQTLDQLQARIIPADAGSTRPSSYLMTWERDHPRGCGEHFVSHEEVSVTMGSSPRMRGARSFSPSHACDRRIIPADAGSTGSSRCSSS